MIENVSGIGIKVVVNEQPLSTQRTVIEPGTDEISGEILMRSALMQAEALGRRNTELICSGIMKPNTPIALPSGDATTR